MTFITRQIAATSNPRIARRPDIVWSHGAVGGYSVASNNYVTLSQAIDALHDHIRPVLLDARDVHWARLSAEERAEMISRCNEWAKWRKSYDRNERGPDGLYVRSPLEQANAA